MTPTRWRIPAVVSALAMLGSAITACGVETEQPETVATAGAAHAHAVVGDTCVICDPTKRDPGRLWCREHDRYEDRCWLCHPELRDPDRPYCDDHGMYEDECVLCDPAGGAAAVTETPPEGELFCNEHGVPEHDCGICQPQLAPTLSVGESLLVRLASARSADLAGLSVARPDLADATTALSLRGEVRFDGNRLARVTPLARGVLTEVRSDVGAQVAAGDVLAVVNAPDVAAAKANYLSAKADLQMWRTATQRQRRLVEEKLGLARELEVARASSRRAQVAVKLASERLLNLGFVEAEIDEIDDARSQLLIRTPFGGTIVERTAVLGAAVEMDAALFVVADLREVWIELAVPETQAAQIQVGTRLAAEVRALPDVTTEGRVTWIDPVVDKHTRMVRARGVLPNTSGALRQGMIAKVKAILETHGDTIRLPSDAVHRVDGLPFVFVQQEPDLFAARRVELGDRLASDHVSVHSGVGPDDLVVMSGGFALKSALLASRLGAGCTDD